MLIRNAMLADGRRRDVRVDGERVVAVAEAGTVDPVGDESVEDATGKRLLPGMIDVHVHFRQPGFSHKETWETGTKSAAAGGVTTVVDQPNTDPPTVDGAAVEGKEAFAADAVVDYGINGGVTPDWDPESLFDAPLFALGEVFLADSTGDMGIGTDQFVRALDRARAHGVPVTVHAEDASRFNLSARERDDADAWSAYRRARAEVAAIREACQLAVDHDTAVHIAHASTPMGIDIAADAGMTTEVTPHHMFLSRSDLSDLGTFGRMNPPLRREKRRQRVLDRVVDGTVDMVATDHAPHTREEKDASIWDAPSGVPGVETALPLLLAEARTGDLTYERIRDLTATNPAAHFGLPDRGEIVPGNYADLVLVDPGETTTVDPDRLHTKCDWTPFEGHGAVFPEWTMVRGTVVYDRDGDEFTAHEGRNVRVAPEPPDTGAAAGGSAEPDSADGEPADPDAAAGDSGAESTAAESDPAAAEGPATREGAGAGEDADARESAPDATPGAEHSDDTR